MFHFLKQSSKQTFTLYLLLALNAWALPACDAGGLGGGEACGVTSSTNAIVYGTDDRREYYRINDQWVRDLADKSVVAVVDTSQTAMNFQADEDFVKFEDLRRLQNGSDGNGFPQATDDNPDPVQGPLCVGEAFRDQPVLSFCSATLIDEDLVLTAGHCVVGRSCNANIVFIFGLYYEQANGDILVPKENVYECDDWLFAMDGSSEGNNTKIDLGVAHLSRAVTTEFEPAPVRAASGPLRDDQSLVMLGFPNGIPMKMNTGKVLDARTGQDFALTNLDLFAGNSGSGVFAGNGELVGVGAIGFQDYVYDADCGCSRVNRVPNDGGAFPGEQVMYAHNAINQLCDIVGWPSVRLCNGTPDPDDGVCSYPETFQTEGACPGPVDTSCGDGVCDTGERQSCSEDCAPDPSSVPDGVDWDERRCGSQSYGTGDGCHCGCGAPDPDCEDPAQPVRRCVSPGATCSAEGLCVEPDAPLVIPDGWRCFDREFNDGNTCHCDCGAVDPDCNNINRPVSGCRNGEVCTSDGTCGQPELPEGATWDEEDPDCAGGFAQGDNVCHCGCGAPDPDCDSFNSSGSRLAGNCLDRSLQCNAQGLCEDSFGESPPGWNCAPRDYEDDRVCTCNENCGIQSFGCTLPKEDLREPCNGPPCTADVTTGCCDENNDCQLPVTAGEQSTPDPG